MAVRSATLDLSDFSEFARQWRSSLKNHAVMVPADEAPPAWWAQVDCFGTKRRCNVLFRKALTEKRQRKLEYYQFSAHNFQKN